MKILELFDDDEDQSDSVESLDDFFGPGGPPEFLKDGWVRCALYTRNGSIFGPDEISRLLSDYPVFLNARLIPLGSGATGDFVVSELDESKAEECSAGWVPLSSISDTNHDALRGIYVRTHPRCFDLFFEIQNTDDAPMDYYEAVSKFGEP